MEFQSLICLKHVLDLAFHMVVIVTRALCPSNFKGNEGLGFPVVRRTVPRPVVIRAWYV